MSEEANKRRAANLVSVHDAEYYARWAKLDPDTFPAPFDSWRDACLGEAGGEGIGMGWYVVLAGDTKQGKTLLAIQMAGDAMMAGRGVGFINLEMSPEQLQGRLYAQITGADHWKIERGKHFDPAEMAKVQAWIESNQSGQTPLTFMSNLDDPADMSEVMACMATWYQDFGVRVFVVDYMQLCKASTQDGIASQTIEISDQIKRFCKLTKSSVIAVSQFNNDGGNANDRSPHAGSLYGGRRIVQDSTQTVLLDHSRRKPSGKTMQTWLICPYNRFGPAFEVPIEWNWNTMRAREAKPDEIRIWPQHEKKKSR